MAWVIFSFWSPEVGSSFSPASPAYVTMVTRSFSVSSPMSIVIVVLSSGSLFSSAIEPLTSSRKTRLLAGRAFRSISFPFRPTRSSMCPGFHGQSAVSMFTENGSFPFGWA